MEEKIVPNQEVDMDINADADVPGNTHLSNDDAELNSHTEKLSADLEEQKAKYIRLSAEFDNFRRRTAKERLELSQTAGKEVILSLLEVLDDIERAENQMKESNDIDQLKVGVSLIFNKLKNTLNQKGLTPMDTLHSEFDVEKQEAIAQSEVEAKLKGKVVEEVEKGYYLNDKILRFAKVVVGK